MKTTATAGDWNEKSDKLIIITENGNKSRKVLTLKDLTTEGIKGVGKAPDLTEL